MKKFEKVKKALEELTHDTNNFITLTDKVDSRHNGKYAIQNVITRNIEGASFKTLNEVIKEHNLKI